MLHFVTFNHAAVLQKFFFFSFLIHSFVFRLPSIYFLVSSTHLILISEPAQIIPCYGKTNTRWLRDFSLKIDPYSTQIFWLLLPYFETALSFGNWRSQNLLFFSRLFLIKFSLSISWNNMSLWTLKKMFFNPSDYFLMAGIFHIDVPLCK